MSKVPPNSPNPGDKPSPHGKFLDEATWEALKAAGYSESELQDDQPFGPIIFSYTRKQAIEDGVLVDLTRPGFVRILAKVGIKVHTAMTATCFATVVSADLLEKREKLPDAKLWEALCRLAAVLTRFRDTVQMQKGDTSRVDFHVEGVDGSKVAMYGHIAPGDQGEPVLTFMLEGED